MPRSHQRADTVEQVDEGALDRAVEFRLRLVEAIDAALEPEPEPEPEPATSDEAATPA